MTDAKQAWKTLNTHARRCLKTLASLTEAITMPPTAEELGEAMGPGWDAERIRDTLSPLAELGFVVESRGHWLITRQAHEALSESDLKEGLPPFRLVGDPIQPGEYRSPDVDLDTMLNWHYGDQLHKVEVDIPLIGAQPGDFLLTRWVGHFEEGEFFVDLYPGGRGVVQATPADGRGEVLLASIRVSARAQARALGA